MGRRAARRREPRHARRRWRPPQSGSSAPRVGEAAFDARPCELVGLGEVQHHIADRPSGTPRRGVPVGIGRVRGASRPVRPAQPPAPPRSGPRPQPCAAVSAVPAADERTLRRHEPRGPRAARPRLQSRLPKSGPSARARRAAAASGLELVLGELASLAVRRGPGGRPPSTPAGHAHVSPLRDPPPESPVWWRDLPFGTCRWTRLGSARGCSTPRRAPSPTTASSTRP